MIQPALEQLRELFQRLLDSNKLLGSVTWLDATPRRLVLKAGNLPVRQPNSVELVTGPPKSAGEAAAAGFARKLGVEAATLKTVKTPKGEYLAYRKKIKGRKTSEILAEALPDCILRLHFPKTMYWTGKTGPRFIRPIRWIVALLGNKVVPFELAGVKSGNITTGHRQLGKKKIRVSIENYAEQLRENFVLLSAAERKQKIESEIQSLLAGQNLRLKPDSELLDTLVYLTEFPTPILGRFDEHHLTLPEEVLITVMRHHQKYFSIVRHDERLAPYFVAVMNSNADVDGLVRAGNERVLRARFNDARFFWDVDQQKKLADRVDDLAHVTYQAQLGSYLDKTRRLIDVVNELGGSETIQRAALLSKCDLTTEMVKEFTELQGVVGGLYAQAQGEPEGVWRAIYEHYKPGSMEEPVPCTEEGRILALADKLDTLRGCFEIGLIPSGSKDPFALRRAAQGVVKILVEGKLPVSLSRLLREDPQLTEFFLDRIRYYFKDVRAFRYDEVNAVLASGFDDLVDVESRLLAIQAVRPTENFEPLAASFKRIQNILRQAQFSGGGELRPQLLEPGPEAELHQGFQSVRTIVEGYRKDKEYRPALETIASLRPKVDLFFDKVLVNAQDENIRQNRLTLLHDLLTELSTIADFSEIVTQ
jgi:glycyl-tRNA synthetase beta chain